uniref:EF-hand domain-containing protein n=1 Tax=Parastrongyloides trichosuri TaxID=131310 RepID=A0A0N4ZWR0_PARTI
MLLIKIIVFLIIFPIISCISDFDKRQLNVLIQKADKNNDYMFDKEELKEYVKMLVRKVPKYYPGTSSSKDAIEGAVILSDDLFKKYDTEDTNTLSFKGTLLKRSKASLFGEVVVKIVVNLLHEIAKLPVPYIHFNPFEETKFNK